MSGVAPESWERLSLQKTPNYMARMAFAGIVESLEHLLRGLQTNTLTDPIATSCIYGIQSLWQGFLQYGNISNKAPGKQEYFNRRLDELSNAKAEFYLNYSQRTRDEFYQTIENLLDALTTMSRKAFATTLYGDQPWCNNMKAQNRLPHLVGTSNQVEPPVPAEVPHQRVIRLVPSEPYASSDDDEEEDPFAAQDNNIWSENPVYVPEIAPDTDNMWSENPAYMPVPAKDTWSENPTYVPATSPREVQHIYPTPMEVPQQRVIRLTPSPPYTSQRVIRLTPSKPYTDGSDSSEGEQGEQQGHCFYTQMWCDNPLYVSESGSSQDKSQKIYLTSQNGCSSKKKTSKSKKKAKSVSGGIEPAGQLSPRATVSSCVDLEAETEQPRGGSIIPLRLPDQSHINVKLYSSQENDESRFDIQLAQQAPPAQGEIVYQNHGTTLRVGDTLLVRAADLGASQGQPAYVEAEIEQQLDGGIVALRLNDGNIYVKFLTYPPARGEIIYEDEAMKIRSGDRLLVPVEHLPGHENVEHLPGQPSHLEVEILQRLGGNSIVLKPPGDVQSTNLLIDVVKILYHYFGNPARGEVIYNDEDVVVRAGDRILVPVEYLRFEVPGYVSHVEAEVLQRSGDSYILLQIPGANQTANLSIDVVKLLYSLVTNPVIGETIYEDEDVEIKAGDRIIVPVNHLGIGAPMPGQPSHLEVEVLLRLSDNIIALKPPGDTQPAYVPVDVVKTLYTAFGCPARGETVYEDEEVLIKSGDRLLVPVQHLGTFVSLPGNMSHVEAEVLQCRGECMVSLNIPGSNETAVLPINIVKSLYRIPTAFEYPGMPGAMTVEELEAHLYQTEDNGAPTIAMDPELTEQLMLPTFRFRPNMETSTEEDGPCPRHGEVVYEDNQVVIKAGDTFNVKFRRPSQSTTGEPSQIYGEVVRRVGDYTIELRKIDDTYTVRVPIGVLKQVLQFHGLCKHK